MKFLIAVSALCALSIEPRPISAQAGARRPDTIAVVDVPATAPWTDTGISVKPGDRVAIRAWGLVKLGGAASGITVGPQGFRERGGGCTYVVNSADVPAQSLVGNVSPALTLDGAGFFVGAQWSGAVPITGTSAPEGRLLLGINDAAVLCDRSGYDSWIFRNNNSGSFTAQVTVTHPR